MGELRSMPDGGEESDTQVQVREKMIHIQLELGKAKPKGGRG